MAWGFRTGQRQQKRGGGVFVVEWEGRLENHGYCVAMEFMNLYSVEDVQLWEILSKKM